MVEQTETVELSLDSNEMFQSAMAEPEKVETPEPEKPDRERDERGRFVAKTEEKPEVKAEEPKPVEAKAPEPPKDDQSGHVPSWRLREVSEERKAADKRAEEAERRAWQFQQQLDDVRRQIAESQRPKEEPINIFENPEGALKQQFTQHLSPIEQRMQAATFNWSLRLAKVEHGAEAVSAMQDALRKAHQQGNPDMRRLDAEMSQSDDPVSIAMQWHKQQKLMEVTGGDPEKYKATIRDELLKDPEFRKQVLELTRAEATAAPNVQLPPSLSKVGTAASNEVGDAGDMSSGALFSDAMSHRRRR